MDLSTVYKINDDYRRATIDKTIHPNDTMHQSGPQHYDVVGQSAVKVILNALELSWTQSVRKILDLPCGHGRVARHLRAAFPSSSMFFCDIDAEGADFCASTFSGQSIHSQPDLTGIHLPRDLDIIWIGSLFTHVDEARTTAWLNYLARHLSDHGILVATFHGLFFTKLVKQHPEMLGGCDWNKIYSGWEKSGYGYAKYVRDDMGDYGISLSSAAKILSIATAIPDTRVLTYTERGWAGNHDVLVITKNDRFRSF